MAKKPVISVLPELTAPPADSGRGRDEGLLTRANPFVILVGMGFATLFTWFLTGGGGNGNGRRPTHMPEFSLGEEVNGQTITGIRTRWEYQIDDKAGWLEEEML